MSRKEPQFAKAADIFAGDVLIAAPHMDDGILGCGGTLLQVEDKRRVHLVYCTHGDCDDFDRAQEARHALQAVGVPQENIFFLNFPDWRLGEHLEALQDALSTLIAKVKPVRVLAPFRFDRHPDHIALNRAVRELAAERQPTYDVTEYFVYFTWRLLPGADVRGHIRSKYLMQVDTAKQALRKREVVEFFKSQTEAPAPGQTRPALTAAYLDVLCSDREYFLCKAQTTPDRELFSIPFAVIRFTHWLEPTLKVFKEKIRTLLAERATPA